MPPAPNVATVFLAAFVPFGLNPTVAGSAVHVYVRFASPPSSPPSTLRLVVLPVTGFGAAAAGVTMKGGAFAGCTWCECEPVLESKMASPWYAATSVNEPAIDDVNAHCAVPVARAAVHWDPAPSLTVTIPVGIPLPGVTGASEIVTVVVSPTWDGTGVSVTIVVVGAMRLTRGWQ